jgi:polysaccharide transporter, PST family
MRKTLINITSLFISVVANRIFPVLLLPFLARELGPEQFGHYVMASAFSYLLAQIVEWGFNMSGVRQIALAAGDKIKLGEIATTVVSGRALIMVILLFGCAVASPWYKWVAPNIVLYWTAISYGLLYAFDLRFVFYGLQESRSFLALTFVQYLLSFLFIIALVRGPSDIWLAFVIPTGFCIVSVMVSLLLLRSRITFSRPTLSSAFAGVCGSIQLFLARNVFQSSSQLGVLILGFFVAPQVVGWYGVNERIIRTLGQLILYPLQMGLTPLVLQKSQRDERRAVLIHLAGLALAASAAAVVGIGLFIFAPQVLTLLLGSSPDEAVHALRLLCVYPLIFIFIHQGGIFWLYLLHWDRENFVILLCYTILFTLLLVLLAAHWYLDGVVAGVLVAGFGLLGVYAVFFTYKGIMPLRQPLGIALASRRQPAA